MPRKPKEKAAYAYTESFPGFDDTTAFPPGKPCGYIIGYSGGTDSSVVLEMAVEVAGAPDLVQPFIMSLLPNMDYIAAVKDYAFRRWGVRVLEYEHWARSWYIRRGMFRRIADPTYARLVQADIEANVRLDTGLDWIGYGYKSIDSLQRRGMMAHWVKGVDTVRRVFAPLRDWNNRHVAAFLQYRRIGMPTDPAMQCRGIDISGECLFWMRRYWPDDYRKMIKVFPLAVAQADRYEAWLKSGDVYGRSTKLKTDYRSSIRPGWDRSRAPDQSTAALWQPGGDQFEDIPVRMPETKSVDETAEAAARGEYIQGNFRVMAPEEPGE